MPMDHTKPIGSQTLPDEDWCPTCEKDVDQWDVYMEDDGEGGYTKIHRCPNCDEKALQDQDGCAYFIVFSVFYYGSLACSAHLTEDDNVRIGLLVLGMLLGLVFVDAMSKLRKKLIYRRRPQRRRPDDPFDVGR